ncbi:hypothetical protein OROMI_003682 [Orobanche minor]
MFGLPSDGLTMEELESFGSDELLTAYWGLFTGKSSNKDVHPSCPKKKFCRPFVFLHDFCCRIIENSAFDNCTNLRFRIKIAILYGEKVNWSHIVLKRLSEEVSKPQSQKKSFGLLLNNILTRSGVRQSKFAKKIGTGKFIGGYKPSAYHLAGPTANRPFLNLMPSAKNPRGVSKKTSIAEDESSKKRKRSVSDSKSPLIEKKKHKKTSKSKARGVPSPSRDPTPNRVPTPVKDSSPIQDPTPIEDPIPTVNPIPVRSPSPAAQSLSNQVEQDFAMFIKWKSYRTAPYNTLFNWKEWKEEEQLILSVTDSKEILLLILMDNEECKELIFNHYLDQDHSGSFHSVQPDSTPVPVAVSEEASRDIPREDLVPLPEQSDAQRQQEPEPTPIPLSSEPEPSLVAASTSIRCPESPRSVARKEQLNDLGRQSLFLQDAVDALYQIGKEMDWLSLTASEEMESVKVEMTKIAEAFNTLPHDLKEAFAKFQQLEEQSLLEEQLKLRTVESQTVAVLEYTDSRISDHDAKIHAMTKVITSFDEKHAKFEEQQDNVLKVLRSIDHTVSEINARKGEGQPDSSRDPAQRSPGQEPQARRSEHDSSQRSSSRPEHQHRS